MPKNHFRTIKILFLFQIFRNYKGGWVCQTKSGKFQIFFLNPSLKNINNFKGPCQPSPGWKSALKNGRPTPELAHLLFTSCSYPLHLTYIPDHLFTACSKVSTFPNLQTLNSETLEYKGIDHPILKSSYLVKTRKPMIMLKSTRETSSK